MKGWHDRYRERGLRVVGVHSPGFEPSRGEETVRAAVSRLGIAYPVLLDGELAVWREYENPGWPARYLFDGHGRLFEYHYGEGAYAETEAAIQELLGVEEEPLPALRPEDASDARLAPQTTDQEGAYSGPYTAGAVWAVLDGSGVLRVSGSSVPAFELEVAHPGAYELVDHGRSTSATIELQAGAGVRCLATCFTPGIV
jgi:hypothetical protein